MLVSAFFLLPGLRTATAGVVVDGAEFAVNSYTTGAQTGERDAAVARLATGGFVVVWDSRTPSGSGYEIFARSFDGSGNAVGGDLQVNSFTTGNQMRAAVAAAPDGFVVVWESDPADGTGRSVRGRLLSGDGTPSGAEFQVNTYTTGDQYQPSVAAEAFGGFDVVWTSAGQDGSGSAIVSRRYDSTATPAGDEVLVNTYTTGDQYEPKVAMDDSGIGMVVWTSDGQDGDGAGVFGNLLDTAGQPLGDEFRANENTAGDQDSPGLSADLAGRFAVVWRDRSGLDGDGDGIFLRRDPYVPSITLQVNSYTTGDQSAPAVASNPDGDFLAVWATPTAGGDGTEIAAQHVRVNSATSAGEVRVNSHTPADQDAPSLAFDAAGNVVVVWQSDGRDGDGQGLAARALKVGCPSTPLAGCRQAGAGRASIKVSDKKKDDKDSIKWTWKRGAATDADDFADPVSGTADYRLCIWDGSADAQPVLNSELPPSGDCSGRPCWSALGGKGYRYKDKAASADGVQQLLLRAGDEGRSKFSAQWRGEEIPSSFALPLTGPVEAQLLVSDDGGVECWASEFTRIRRSDGKQFSATGP